MQRVLENLEKKIFSFQDFQDILFIKHINTLHNNYYKYCKEEFYRSYSKLQIRGLQK